MSHPHGCVSWNSRFSLCALLGDRSHPHGCVSWNLQKTPLYSQAMSHTLTGVWVEISDILHFRTWLKSHTLTGVWVEILFLINNNCNLAGHTLTGVWVEIWFQFLYLLICNVTPSRVCELKLPLSYCTKTWFCHTLTGVWVEIWEPLNKII